MCFVHFKFRLDRLRRWPSSSPNPNGEFHCIACMRHANSRRLGRQHTRTVEIPSADCPNQFSTLLLTSGQNDHTKFALLVTQHTWDEFCSHFFQRFTFTRLPLSSTDCPAKTSRGCHLHEALKPNLLAAWSQYAPTPAVHLQSPFVTLHW